jgi:hypothetical protein
MSKAELRSLQHLASQIENDAHLERVLAESSVHNRLEMYESLKAFLSFKPKTYHWFTQRLSS